jgi:hypothetical protein
MSRTPVSGQEDPGQHSDTGQCSGAQDRAFDGDQRGLQCTP